MVRRAPPARLAAPLFTLAILCLASASRAAPRVGLVDEGERVHGSLAKGRLSLASTARLEALRGEHAAVQIAVETDRALERLELQAAELVGPGGARLALDAFVEHYVEVRARSRNDRLADSLAFTAAARPSDASTLGLVPDALVPLGLAAPWVGPNEHVPAGQRRAFWLEVYVPDDATPGRYRTKAEVRASGALLGELELELEVLPQRLPYQATRFFAYYERKTLERRFVEADRVERELWQTLHAHHLDAVTMLLEPSDVERIAGALDARWFTPAEGYLGPGRAEPPSVVFFGAYGLLGEPDASALARAEALELATRRHHPVGSHLVYAVDETCESPRGPAWRRLLAARPELGLGVVHTCHEDARGQDVDVIMQPAQAFRLGPALEARASGREVYVYNGQLPYAPPLMLDAPATALTLSGWLAAGFETGRWFYWETIFWDDGNRGGRGPRDVYADPESFHNADGDVALLDGLLLYPGRGHAPGARSLEHDAVLPSLRLKRLRRGIEDSGLLALATLELGPVRGAAFLRRLVPAAFDELAPGEPSRFDFEPARHAALRASLRRSLGDRAATRAELDGALSSLRREVEDRGASPRPTALGLFVVRLALPLALFALAVAGLRLGALRRRGATASRA